MKKIITLILFTALSLVMIMPAIADEIEAVIISEIEQIEILEEVTEEVAEESTEETSADFEEITEIVIETEDVTVDVTETESVSESEETMELLEAYSGQCGEEAFWKLDEYGNLLISGSGEMYDFELNNIEGRWDNTVKSVTISSGITSIGNAAFANCSSLANVSIPDSVTRIGDTAFFSCSSLKHIEIPQSTVTIGSSVFEKCSLLKSAGPKGSGSNIEFGWTTKIPDNVFWGSLIEAIVFPEGLEEIGEFAFSSTQLSKVVIPDGVKTIRMGAFCNCKKLEKVSIPVSVVTIENYVFEACSRLTSAGPIGSECNIEYSWTKKIPMNAFGNSSLKSVKLPAGLEEVGKNAFVKCTSIVDVYYGGTKEDSEKLTIANGNSNLEKASWHYTESSVIVTFNDIQGLSATFQKAINWLSEQGIAKGYDDGSFGQAKSCTRKQFAIMLYRFAGKPKVSGTIPFSDCQGYGGDSYKAILWASQNGIVKGYSDGTFRPNNTVTRQQVMIMLYRYAGKPKVSGKLALIDVTANPGSDTYNAILWGSVKKLTKGTSATTFSPNNSCLRRQIALFLYRFNQMN